ncbi:MAG: branched chain amino acid aminotransferase, partial [Mycobacterium sp.]|nr:branched chain amino acid aminotransferase [Mycobacterium sp.]
MALSTQFTRIPHPAPASEQRVSEVLADPGFGRYFTDHMVSIEYRDGQWTNPTVGPYQPLSMDPASMVFHYGQAIFEGLKAYREPDGTVACFRADTNAARFRRSAR